MSARLIRIETWEGEIDAPDGPTPPVELRLQDEQRVVGLRIWRGFNRWFWSAQIEMLVVDVTDRERVRSRDRRATKHAAA